MAAEKVDWNVQDIFTILSNSTNNPEQFLGVQNDVAEKLRGVTKKLYDLTKSLESGSDTASDALSELITQNFDDEQVWQQLELHNTPSVSTLVSSVSKTSTAKCIGFQCVRSKAGKDGDSPAKKQKLSKKSRKKSVSDSEQELDEDQKENDMEQDGDDDDDDDSDDPLRLDREPDNESDMSEEEKEMVALLAKARAALPPESDESDEGDLNADFELGVPKAITSNQTTKPEENSSDKRTKGGSTLEKRGRRRTEVDDKFFQLADMETFLDQEDVREERKLDRQSGSGQRAGDSSEEEIDYFADIPSEEEDEMKYDDFFDQPEGAEEGTKNKKQSFSNRDEKDRDEDGEQDEETSEDSSEDSKTRKKESSFEKRQQRLQEKISRLEGHVLEEKPWQQRGEISSAARPENSLLQEDLEFDHTARLAPVITEETTKSLEDIIKQRIKDKVWDDVERKDKPKEEAYEYKKRVVLDQEKSKQSLSQIYESEFLKQQQKEETEEKDPAREDIRKSMQALFIKLDALSNFHYTPKPAVAEVKVISNQPSLALEEVAPVAVSDAALLAPEEVQEKPRGDVKGDTEKSATDRKHERREKKQRQREKFKRREAKADAMEKKGLGKAQVQAKALHDLEKQSKTGKGVKIIKEQKSKKSGLTSSNQFFTQLQEEVTTHIQSKKAGKKLGKSTAKAGTKYML